MSIKFRERRELRINKQQIILGLIAWLMFSYILYAIFYLFREKFRVLTGSPEGYQPLLLLSNSELFIYNLFYAAVASSIGFMFSARFVLTGINRNQSRKTRYFIRNVLNEQGFLTWSFLFWFVKVTSLLGICYLMIPLQYDLAFIIDSPLLLILLPIVLFLGVWPSMRRLFGSQSLKWLGTSFVIFVAMSFLFAMKNFIDVDKVNHSFLKNNIDYAYSLDLPKSQSHERVEKLSLVTDVYVVFDSAGFRPLIFFDDINRPVVMSNLKREIKNEKDKLSMYEQDRWMPILHIDDDISMSFIKKLKYEFRKSNVRRIMFSTGMKYSNYPSVYPTLKYSGISINLWPRYFPEFESFLDSAETMDRNKYSIRLPESLMYRVNLINKHNRIEVSLSATDIKINGQKVHERKFEEVVYGFYKKFSPEGVVIFNVENDVSYKRYVEILDVLYWQIDKLRNEMSWEIYDEPFDQWDRGEKRSVIVGKYPRSIVEWTFEEQRLIKLLE